MPIYATDSAGAVAVTPLDSDAIIPYSWDWSAWLSAETISSQKIVADTGIGVGDGVTTVTKRSVIYTPATVAQADGIVTAWLYADGVTSGTYEVVCHIATNAGRVDERTITVEVTAR